MGLSPTQLTLRRLRSDTEDPSRTLDEWPLIQVVEVWNPHARVRQDLFGIIDVLAVGPHGVLAIQATSRGNVSSRVKKIKESPALPILSAQGWDIEVWGWEKKKNRWQLGRSVGIYWKPGRSVSTYWKPGSQLRPGEPDTHTTGREVI